jgi:hypothetical protein
MAHTRTLVYPVPLSMTTAGLLVGSISLFPFFHVYLLLRLYWVCAATCAMTLTGKTLLSGRQETERE